MIWTILMWICTIGFIICILSRPVFYSAYFAAMFLIAYIVAVKLDPVASVGDAVLWMIPMLILDNLCNLFSNGSLVSYMDGVCKRNNLDF